MFPGKFLVGNLCNICRNQDQQSIRKLEELFLIFYHLCPQKTMSARTSLLDLTVNPGSTTLDPTISAATENMTFDPDRDYTQSHYSNWTYLSHQRLILHFRECIEKGETWLVLNTAAECDFESLYLKMLSAITTKSRNKLLTQLPESLSSWRKVDSKLHHYGWRKKG